MKVVIFLSLFTFSISAFAEKCVNQPLYAEIYKKRGSWRVCNGGRFEETTCQKHTNEALARKAYQDACKEIGAGELSNEAQFVAPGSVDSLDRVAGCFALALLVGKNCTHCQDEKSHKAKVSCSKACLKKLRGPEGQSIPRSEINKLDDCVNPDNAGKDTQQVAPTETGDEKPGDSAPAL